MTVSAGPSETALYELGEAIAGRIILSNFPASASNDALRRKASETNIEEDEKKGEYNIIGPKLHHLRIQLTSPKLLAKLINDTPNNSSAKPKLWSPPLFFGSRSPSLSSLSSSRNKPPQPTKKHESPIATLANDMRILYDIK